MFPSVENAGLSAAAPARSASPRIAPDAASEREPPRDGAASGEAEAWAGVVAGWEDEARHRDYLARFTDLEGLATAGRRYRDVLLARPADPIAARLRDEVLRRAMALGFAALPRTAPAVAARSRRAVRVAALAVVAALGAAAVLAVRVLGSHLGAAP
jgi:hypothetical protein